MINIKNFHVLKKPTIPPAKALIMADNETVSSSLLVLIVFPLL